MSINLYIDSADRVAVTELLKTGLFRGVTTNPAILDKAGLSSVDLPNVIRWATDAGAERVFVQVWGDNPSEMVDLGRQLREIRPNVVIKVPYSRRGLRAAKELSQDGETLVTAIHEGSQVLPVAASGTTFLAPFVGRMDQAGRDGMAAALAMQRALDGLQSQTKILAGSLRTPEQVLTLAQAGVQHFTMGPLVWEQFFEDDVTSAAVKNFESLATSTRP